MFPDRDEIGEFISYLQKVNTYTGLAGAHSVLYGRYAKKLTSKHLDICIVKNIRLANFSNLCVFETMPYRQP